ncbi:DUF1365 family protein [Rhodoplanes sp. TEM]|uniref:DUF1365 family protein n=1 Tax=Rhodoplanes tepidamans TaxID=200616 RepID=A0ABT5JGQ7_RHOTP|nr:MULTISPECIES: DUF1365 family protein [Rhodoplanes]MDC7788598.1 DUF1365 family protein [Rhodoplanes tepidamans]MDC7986854.1 DUF1365 family protein [Rhodoplanes sp. TEM]MDQ0358581.1 DUF1365 family protein [Rhodoplanes tepidamans]
MTGSAAVRSAVYTGAVVHRRLKPRAHALRYRCFWMLLDLDEIDALAATLRLFSRDRFNLFTFRNADHGAGTEEPLRAQVDRMLAEAGIDLAGGSVQILTMPRVLGYVFNPLSVYFCRRADATLAAVLYEVTNTFGDRHSYLIPVEPEADGTVRQTCDKLFYVSPFMDMDLRYAFRVSPPDRDVAVAIRADAAGEPVIVAALTGRRRALSDGTLLKTFLAHPLITWKVIAAIHWEALKLWRKGVGLRPHQAPPARPVTIVRT